MFKYISEILSQFSTPQKITALSMLLLSIVLISISPSLINAINIDREELNTEIARKNSKIKNLEKQVDVKDELIRSGQSECTNRIVQREIEFISMLEDLKKMIRREEKIKNLTKESMIILDTVSGHIPEPIDNRIIKSDMSNVIQQIDLIEDKIKK